MSNAITTGLRVPSQLPLDVKLHSPSEVILSALGTANNLAYTYYLGMRVYCVQERTIWEWREPDTEIETGLLDEHFLYPAGLVVDGVDYGEKEYNFFKVLQASDIVIPTVPQYNSNNVGTSGADVYRDATVVGDNITFNFRKLAKSIVGNGETLLTDIVVEGNEILVKVRAITSDNLLITVEEDGTLKINNPTVSSNLAFYVDENSTASIETGSIASPFKTLNKALDAFIGTGTWDAPQFTGYKIELLSSVTLLEDAGVDYNGYVNLDINYLNIEGKNLYLGLHANPDVDYYPISLARMAANAPKTANILNNEMRQTYSNVIFQRIGSNTIVHYQGYCYPPLTHADPIAAPQNGTSLTLNNCRFANDTVVSPATNPNWAVVPDPDNSDNPATLFGTVVYASNLAAIGKPMILVEEMNWNKEISFEMTNCSMENSTGTCLKVKNTATTILGITHMNRNHALRYYDNFFDGIYTPKTGLYYIETDNARYFKIADLRCGLTVPAVATSNGGPLYKIGGSQSMIKATNNGTLGIDKGISEEQYYNMTVMDSDNSAVSFGEFYAETVNNYDEHGAFRVVDGFGTGKTISISKSTIKQVYVDAAETDTTYIKGISGYNNVINNAPHSTYPSYTNDSDAKISGNLIAGNIYYNTTVGALKTIL